MQQLWRTQETGVVIWDLDTETLRRNVEWATRSNMFDLELAAFAHYQERFLTFTFSLARADSLLNDIHCSRCGEFVGFKEGLLQCVSCGQQKIPSHGSRLCLTGRMRSLVGSIKTSQFVGRPGIAKIYRRHKGFPKKWFAVAGDQVFFAPRIYVLYPSNWNSVEPKLFLEKAYFKEIGLNSWSPVDYHAYSANFSGLRWICLTSFWQAMSMAEFINQRMIPKIIMDLMISDLIAVGRLKSVLSSLRTDTHNVYNVIGRDSQKAQRFRELYNHHVEA